MTNFDHEEMNPIQDQPVNRDEQVTNITEQPKKRWASKKPRVKSFVSTVSAGVIGSVLTLTLVTNTDLLQPESSQAKEIPVSGQTENSSYKVQQTAAGSISIPDIVEKSSKAIVGIVNQQSQNNPFAQSQQNVAAGTGSGVIFKKDGDKAYIVTNNHVIEGAQSIEVSFESGEKTTAELVGTDALTDLAVLKIDAKYAEAVLEFGDSDTLRAGDQVVAIGNPLGLDFSRTVTQGIVSGVNRTIDVTTSAGKWDLNVIQTDAAINPGNSGGALIDSSGKLIGINSLKIAENGVEGLGFAIPSNDAVPLIEEMMKNGKIERPYLGVTLAELDAIPYQYVRGLPAEIEGGVMVTSVDPESAAAEAGFQMQDIIVSIDDQPVKNATDLRKYLYSKVKPGEKASLKVYRGSDMKNISVKLASK